MDDRLHDFAELSHLTWGFSKTVGLKSRECPLGSARIFLGRGERCPKTSTDCTHQHCDPAILPTPPPLERLSAFFQTPSVTKSSRGSDLCVDYG